MEENKMTRKLAFSEKAGILLYTGVPADLMNKDRRIEDLTENLQLVTGMFLQQVLAQAVAKNHDSNRFSNGEIADKVNPISVEALPHNNSTYTILVGMDSDAQCYWTPTRRGYSVLEVNVDTKRVGQELYYAEGCYPEHYGYVSFNEINEFIAKTTTIVGTFRLFLMKQDKERT